jgi:hypothetical protein
VSYPLNAAPEAKMQNDFDEIAETTELTEEAAELVKLYRNQRTTLAQMVDNFGPAHSSVLQYSKVVSLTARELLDEHGVDADEVADELDAQAKAQDILNHISTRQRATMAFALASVQHTTVVHPEAAYVGSFYEVIGRLPIAIPADRADALRSLVSAKALAYDVRPAKVSATTNVYHQVILTDLGRALLAELDK